MDSRAVSHHSISIARDCLPNEFGMGSWVFSQATLPVTLSFLTHKMMIFSLHIGWIARDKSYDTMDSRAVSHHSISIAHDCLPYEFGMGSWVFSQV
ncbi:hypothetical protein PROFUN_04132 [Planoprotostelium fungivorum]|uniref:Uncharacterized protein n=1 Tax=Planoprotostelium fungivorum TaxID=1890364 RepID=A0A2P6NJL4_9EUKA|nr:hypothetical protein PROFUN_04132 [Planoprotostelium fungivorum]